MDEKREHVRNYIIHLLNDGTFNGVKTPLAVVTKAIATFTKDVGVVVSDMTAQFAEHHGPKMQAAAIEGVQDFIGNVLQNGLKNAWASLKDQHARGMEANARNRR
jgi:hypothetical protein